jgi:UDP-glucose 4-epimerase
VFVRDVARANVLASTAELPPPSEHDSIGFNIATSSERSVVDLAETVGRVLGVTPVIQFADSRAGELQRSSLDTSKARRVLGWKPEHAFEAGLSELISWFESEEKNG